MIRFEPGCPTADKVRADNVRALADESITASFAGPKVLTAPVPPLTPVIMEPIRPIARTFWRQARKGTCVSARAARGLRLSPRPRRLQEASIMANYVDGFVVPVPRKKIDVYRKLARKAGKVWREHGALDYVECVADDVKPGKHTSFPQSVKLKPDEVVVFSWIVYKSRRQRDRINAKVMKDPRLASMMDPKAMPFDGKRMFWGGFKVMVNV